MRRCQYEGTMCTDCTMVCVGVDPLSPFFLFSRRPATPASLAIVDRFLSNFVPPIVEEGFTRQHVLEWSVEEGQRERILMVVLKECNRA